MGLGNFFRASKDNISKWLGLAYHWLKPIMISIGEILLTTLMDQGIAIIKAVVQKYMTADVPTEDKFELAKGEITDAFKDLGMEVKDSLINLAIELFVSVFKNRLV